MGFDPNNQRFSELPGNLLRSLVANMFYPAVLGAIFHTCLLTGDKHAFKLETLVPVVLILVYFVIDYCFTVWVHCVYSWKAFLLDISAMGLTAHAAVVLERAEWSQWVYLWIGLVHFVYVIWDLSEKARQLLWHNVTCCAFMAIAGLCNGSWLVFCLGELAFCCWFAWITFKSWSLLRAEVIRTAETERIIAT